MSFIPQSNKGHYYGMALAGSCALINSSIPIFTKELSSIGMNESSIAFYRAFTAFLIIQLYFSIKNKKYFIGNKAYKTDKSKTKMQFFIAGFLGLFCMFFFETIAYKYASASVVVFLMFSSSIVLSLIIDVYVRSKTMNVKDYLSLFSHVSGMLIILLANSNASFQTEGLIFSIAAGISYGLFSFYMKSTNISHNAYSMRYIFFFGSLLLFFPAFFNGFSPITAKEAVLIIGLSLFPSIIGLTLAIKSLNYLSVSRFQIISSSEPFFVVILAYFLLSEIPGYYQVLGGLLILLGFVFDAINGIHKNQEI